MTGDDPLSEAVEARATEIEKMVADFCQARSIPYHVAETVVAYAIGETRLRDLKNSKITEILEALASALEGIDE